MKIEDQNSEKKLDLLRKAAETAKKTPLLPKNKPKQTKGIQTADTPHRIYDTKIINEFLDVVFHAGLPQDGENILCWRTNAGKPPSYPVSDEQLIKALERSKNPSALYYGTSTCFTDPSGNLRNRKALFSALHVVVLDDIGTKIPFDKIPKDFAPTYKIESSVGNFQYGYVLTNPVHDLGAAEALIQLVYESGCSDEGGKMPTKLVRLPEGINGKIGPKRDFISTLHGEYGKTYSPQEILNALELDVRWEDVISNAAEVTKRRAGNSVGATPWVATRPTAPALDGLIDPVLEWLYENDQVIQDNGEWVDILCPWAEGHTDGEQSAGYMPLGRGGSEDTLSRGFHCFHGHCTANKTKDLLHYVVVNGGPEAGVRDFAAHLTASWVYDSASDQVWEIKDVAYPMALSMTAFRTKFPHSIAIQNHKGETVKVKETALWNTSKSRVDVSGQAFAPNTTARIVEIDGRNYLNTFAPPKWGVGDIEQHHTDMFTEFLNYLIPGNDEREFFLDWLAAKVKNMGFRGPAILMVARRQGVGRTTLTDMITTLLGSQNTQSVDFTKIIGEAEFNEWVEAPLVISDETLNAGTSDFYHSYEKLKSLIDPRPKKVVINPKYGKKRETIIHSSFIFLSNHGNAIVLPETDRRFYVLDNAVKPASPAYFTRLNEWLDKLNAKDKPEWAASVWRWLMARDVDVETLLAPPKTTLAKSNMVQESRSTLEVAVDAVLRLWPSEYITTKDISDSLDLVGSQIGLFDMKNPGAIIKRLAKAKTYPFEQKIITRGEGYASPVRPRLIATRIDMCVVAPKTNGISKKEKTMIGEALLRPEMGAFAKELSSFLALEDI